MARSKQVPRGRRYKNSRALSSPAFLHFCPSKRSRNAPYRSQAAKASQALLVNVRPVVECLTSGQTHLPIFVSSISRLRPRIADSLERRTAASPATRSYAAESFTGHRFEALRSKPQLPTPDPIGVRGAAFEYLSIEYSLPDLPLSQGQANKSDVDHFLR
ncbi:hypothetical protein NA56DRAFT_417266 [Hyaloscypha hepaticicola]|uniref:Uncharacterized protein n=1 Tax=Hyaloscypha hepaticicola TaxID=2082293 RepID=A0A2J6PHX3_9HELO|nr:hypothetical protein NA56DRAFT_417266 [Hyaloscypha hepaticicola]